MPSFVFFAKEDEDDDEEEEEEERRVAVACSEVSELEEAESWMRVGMRSSSARNKLICSFQRCRVALTGGRYGGRGVLRLSAEDKVQK